MVELVRRYSKQASAWEELNRVFRLRGQTGAREPEVPVVATPRFKLDQRLDAETTARIVADYEAGAPSTQLMADFGLGKGSVLQLLHEAGVRMRGQSLSLADLDAAVAVYDSGLSLQKVGEHFGVSVDAVRNAFLRNGVQMRARRGWNYEA